VEVWSCQNAAGSPPGASQHKFFVYPLHVGRGKNVAGSGVVLVGIYWSQNRPPCLRGSSPPTKDRGVPRDILRPFGR
jgi:hypothetical protein